MLLEIPSIILLIILIFFIIIGLMFLTVRSMLQAKGFTEDETTGEINMSEVVDPHNEAEKSK